MKEGLSKEPEIIQEFLNTMNEKGHKRIKVERSGLIAPYMVFWQLVQMVW